MADTIAETVPEAKKKDAFGLLRANRPFRLLWLSRIISFVGNALGIVGLMFLIGNSTDQAFAVALLMIASDFVPSLLSPLTGTLSDRVDRRYAMVGGELVQGVILTLIALLKLPLPLLLLLVVLQSAVSQIFAAALRSSVPALVGDNDLESANSALGLSTNGLEVVGPLLAAVLLLFLDLEALLLIDAVSFFLAALMLVRLPALPGALKETDEQWSFLSQAKEGLHYIWAHPAIRTIGLSFFAVVAFTAIDDVALYFLAKHSLAAGDSGTSLLLAGAGVGLLLGFAVLVRFGHRMPALTLLVVGYVLNSSGNLFTGLSWAIPAAFTMQAIRGIGVSFSDMANNTLVQRLVPPHLLGRVFSNIYGAIGIAASLSYVLGGVLIDFTSPRLVLALAGAGGLVSAAFVAFRLPSALRQVSTAVDAGMTDAVADLTEDSSVDGM